MVLAAHAQLGRLLAPFLAELVGPAAGVVAGQPEPDGGLRAVRLGELGDGLCEEQPGCDRVCCGAGGALDGYAVWQGGVVESLALGDWRPASFLVVAQLDVTVEGLENRSLTVEPDEAHGEHSVVVRLPVGLVFCLVATPGTPLGGFVVLLGDPGQMGWKEALDVFLSQTPFDRSDISWVPGDEPDGP